MLGVLAAALREWSGMELCENGILWMGVPVEKPLRKEFVGLRIHSLALASDVLRAIVIASLSLA